MEGSIKPSTHTGMRLEWGPKEIDDLRKQVAQMDEVIEFLKCQVQLAPCLLSRPGEGTYECRIDSPCRVCEWRLNVHRTLVKELEVPEGIW